ncbi:MAG: DUF4097 domain-containing protein [Mycobacteriales bacterium]
MTTFSTDGPLDARVRFHGGTVEVDATGAGPAGATVEPIDPNDSRSVEAANAARIDCVGSRLIVDVPGKGRWRGGVQVHISLQLPPLSKLTSESGEVRLHSTGELADLVVRTGSGDVHAAEVRDGVDIKAGDATVVVGGSPQRLSFTAGNGQLTADAAGDVMFKTGHGRATLGSTSGAVMVKGGNVQLDLGAARSGEVFFQTGAGSARIGVAEGTSVQLDLQSALGDVRCDLPMEQGAPTGGSDLKVRLVTGLGDLVVGRAT